MFFELSWAFGASESFLSDNLASENAAAARRAQHFLQIHVTEGLMPARSSIQSRNHNDQPILFSRHWHSTVHRFCEDAKQIDASTYPLAGSEGDLIALPFMPTGQSDRDRLIHSLLDDIAARQDRWLDRALKFRQCNTALPDRPAGLDWIRPAMATLPWQEKLTLALNAYRLSREWLLNMSQGLLETTAANGTAPKNWTADLDDLIELAAWSALRLQLFFGGNGGSFPNSIGKRPSGSVAKALYEAQWVRHSLPDLESFKAGDCIAENVIATGYVCSGSWMYGVDETSRSSEIQTQILATLTSLETSESRAKAGAGMPARKDFFYLKGGEPVTGMEYLHWREFLRYGGSRARRRDRVLSASGGEPPVDPTSLYGTIHREMLACLRSADILRQQYASNDQNNRRAAIEQMVKRAQTATEAIYAAAKQATARR
jgi:hypothetical protein